MKKIIAVFGLGALLLGTGQAAMAQTEEPTLSGDSLRTVEGRSLSLDDYESFLADPETNGFPVRQGIRRYEIRRQRQQTIEIVPGLSIPADAVDNQGNQTEVIIDDRGDKSGEGFKVPVGSF